MDIPEMAAEPEIAAEQEQPEEYDEEPLEEMRRVSRSDARIYYTSRTLSWTYDLRSQTYREMLVRTGSRSRRCSEPSWRDCLQQQDLMHHHQHRDVSVTSWFIFTPLALCFLFSISAHCGQCRF
jgi:hypothetical protein